MDLLRVFYAPKKAMRNVLEKNKFPWMVLLIMLLYPNISNILNFAHFRDTLYTQLQRQFAMAGTSMPPAQMQTILSGSLIGGFFGTVLTALVMWFLFSAMLAFVAGFYDNERPFKGLLCIVGYAEMISVLAMVFSAIMLRLGYENIDLSLAMFLKNPLQNLVITTLFRSFSLFRIWKYFVIYIGLTFCVETKGKAAAVTIIMFILATAVMVVPMMFMPQGLVA